MTTDTSKLWDNSNKDIPHSDLARCLLDSHSFLTPRDTERVLYYDPNSGIYRFNGEIKIKELTQSYLCNNGLANQAKTTYINAIIDFIRRETYIDREELNNVPGILTIKNGVLNLETGKVSKHSKSYKSTILIPVNYDPEAKCPQIDQFISEVVEPKNIPLIYEIPAWCLSLYSKIQRVVILIGEGANGKTTYVDLLNKFLGRDNCTACSMQTLATNKFAKASLYGKLANIHDDLSSSALRDPSILKMLSGGSPIHGEKKFETAFDFDNTAKLVFTANRPPEISEDTLALWRRFVICDFPYKFVGKIADHDLSNKITTEQELSGFLNKVIDSLGRLKKNGDFSYSTSIEDTRLKYQLISNPTATFIENYCKFDTWATIKKEDLYQAFMNFCEEHKLSGLSKKAFGHKIKRDYNLGEEHDSWRSIEIKKITGEVLESE